MVMQRKLGFYCFCNCFGNNHDCKYTTIWAEGFKIAALTTQEGIALPVCRQTFAVDEIKNGIYGLGKMIEKAIFPSTVPPTKIKVKKVEKQSFLKKLWQ
jgi:hypothetical protein